MENEDMKTNTIFQQYDEEAKHLLAEVVRTNPTLLPQALLSIKLSRLILRYFSETIGVMDKSFEQLASSIDLTLKG